MLNTNQQILNAEIAEADAEDGEKERILIVYGFSAGFLFKLTKYRLEANLAEISQES